jgi:hypothetical protein
VAYLECGVVEVATGPVLVTCHERLEHPAASPHAMTAGAERQPVQNHGVPIRDRHVARYLGRPVRPVQRPARRNGTG